MSRAFIIVATGLVAITLRALGDPMPPAPDGSRVEPDPGGAQAWQREFDLSNLTLNSSGRSAFFVLEPGYQTVLKSDSEQVIITVLDETKEVNGVLTRIVEEREWRYGRLVEVSSNYFALCADTQNVYYFGESVQVYIGGTAVRSEDSWLAGVGGARPGLIMPGAPRPGMRYYQEVAPGVAMDRAEVIGCDYTLATPSGTFSNCLKTVEGSALDPAEREFKLYAPGIGLIQDDDLLLTKYGFVETTEQD